MLCDVEALPRVGRRHSRQVLRVEVSRGVLQVEHRTKAQATKPRVLECGRQSCMRCVALPYPYTTTLQ